MSAHELAVYQAKLKRKSGRPRIPVPAGTRFGHGVVLYDAGLNDRDTKQEYRSALRCDCGRVYIASNSHLRSGSIISCGCIHDQKASARLRKFHEGGFLANTGLVRDPVTGQYRKSAAEAQV